MMLFKTLTTSWDVAAKSSWCVSSARLRSVMSSIASRISGGWLSR